MALKAIRKHNTIIDSNEEGIIMGCSNYPAMSSWDWDRFDDVYGREYEDCIDEDGNPIEYIDPREVAYEMAVQDRIDMELGK